MRGADASGLLWKLACTDHYEWYFVIQELSWSGVYGRSLRSTGEAVQVWLECGLW